MPPVATLEDAEHGWSTPLAFISYNNLLGVRLTSSGSSVAAALVGNGSTLVVTALLANTAEMYVTYGGPGLQATTSHFPIPPGLARTFTIPKDGSVTWVAAIIASGSGTVLVHRGFGV